MRCFRWRSLLLIPLLLGLTACGDGGVEEVQVWMEEVKRGVKVSIPKLSEPKTFMPFIYGARNEVDPFNPIKLSVALAKAKASSGSGLKPNLDRRREPLESYPLDSIRMVGTLQRAGLSYALLQVDKTVFQAKLGNHVGQNLGMITRITETEVEIKEIVQDAAGDWVERKAKLELQEASK